MKKRILVMVLAVVTAAAVLAACNSGGGDSGGTAQPANPPAAGDSSGAPAASGSKQTLNLYTFTNEVDAMWKYYTAKNTDWPYEINATVIATDDGNASYQIALDQALMAGGADAPDFYAAESAFVLKYTQGNAKEFAANYDDLGIDTENAIKAANIAEYTVDIGTRDGKVVALGYQATGSAFIYRRSIATDVFGTDDPAAIEKEIGPGWDKFFSAADKVKAAGYSMLSGASDLWFIVRRGNIDPYVVNDKFTLDPVRESFLDYAKKLKEEDLTNESGGWSDEWKSDMGGGGKRQVFGYFGPAWLINYVMKDVVADTFGDWAITVPPVGFSWGGTWLFGNKDTKVKDGVKDLIYWITLDTSDSGLQYLWANGLLDTGNPTNLTYSGGTKDTVASGVVMDKSDGKVDLLGGQNMFEIFVPANAFATGDNMCQYDEDINAYVEEAAADYANGLKTRDEAVDFIKQQVKDKLGIDS